MSLGAIEVAVQVLEPFNPYRIVRGVPGDAERNADDLSNIEAGSTRVTKVHIADKLISLPGVRSIIGRILAVNADADDLSKGIHELTKITGN